MIEDISFRYIEVAQSKGINVCYALVEDMPYEHDLFDPRSEKLA